MSKENLSAWFRWITPILLGIMSASNARIWSKMDTMESKIGSVLEKSSAYTDKISAPLAEEIKEHAKDIVDLRVGLARFGRKINTERQ